MDSDSVECKDVGRRLVPWPSSIVVSGGRFPLPGLRAEIDGDDRCHRAVERVLASIGGDGGGKCAVPFRVCCAGEEQGGSAYRLICAPGGVELTAGAVAGVVAGLETLWQLARGPRLELPEAAIDDRPRFAWRGLLLDCVRHWMPLDVVKRTLDGMAAVKLNVFHWHLTDDQGFRIESRSWPRLHERGSGGVYYSHQDVHDIVDYAADRGIRVVPEFDLPGHSASWLAAYPDLAVGTRACSVETRWGVFDARLDVTSESVYVFLDRFFAEMSSLFPDPVVHIGGDEVPGREWLAQAHVREFMASQRLETAAELQAYFTRRLAAILEGHGKRVIGWEEVAGAGTASPIVELYSGRPVPVTGGEVVVSTGFYLDHCLPAAFHYAQEPHQLAAGVAPECVVGAEACLWSEFVTAENVETRLWPRLGAIAERFWSPAESNPERLYERLDRVLLRLESLGMNPRQATAAMLAGFRDVLSQELIDLAAVVEPVKEYARLEWRTYTSETLLDRLVDVVPPESEAARHFREAVRLRAESPAMQHLIKEFLLRWLALSRNSIFAAKLANDPVLAELLPLVRSLGRMAEAGLRAFEHKLSSADRAALQASVEAAAKPCAELQLAVVDGIRELLAGAQSD